MKAKRIIFVGIHNKPKLSPLDPSTKSGKIIDRVIEQLQNECIKTNLFNIDYKPSTKEIGKLKEEWYWTHLPTNEDIIILLGENVQKHFDFDCRVIKAEHPASRRIKDMNKYINELVTAIKQPT